MHIALMSRFGVCAVVFAFVAGCGSQTATDTPAEGSISGEAAEVQEMADQTLAQLGGDAGQREAKHYLEFRAMNQPYEECMQDHGIDFVADYHTINAGYVPDGTSGTWMGALNRRPSDFYLANAEAGHDDQTGNLTADEQTREFQKAQDACDDTNAFTDSPAGEPEIEALQAEYFEILSDVEKQLGPIAPYTACMEDAGIDYISDSDGEEGWGGLYIYLGSQMPRPPLPGEEADDSWLDYLDLEARALAADAECRAGQYERGLELLGPMLRDFRSRNADQLRASSQMWEAYVARAHTAGWTYQKSD
jgi:hypothetical protein